jgi:hypothetical protein
MSQRQHRVRGTINVEGSSACPFPDSGSPWPAGSGSLKEAWRMKSECYTRRVAFCRVSYRDIKGIEHAIEVEADTLFEAVAQAVQRFR